VRRTIPPSAVIEEQIDRLLAVGGGREHAGIAVGAGEAWRALIIQRAVEEEFHARLGSARYERRPEAPPGLRNGFRPRRVQTAERELSVEIPQVREAAEPFVSKLFPRADEVAAHRAASGNGGRRVRPRPIDARSGIAVRAGRAGLSDVCVRSG
jgi:hypothetical protein